MATAPAAAEGISVNDPDIIIARLDKHLAAFPCTPALLVSRAEYEALRAAVRGTAPHRQRIHALVAKMGCERSAAALLGVKPKHMRKAAAGTENLSRRAAAVLADERLLTNAD